MQRYTLSLLLLLSATTVMAETAYRSVDGAGHVTFSSTPPSDSVDVEAVPLAPSPSKADVEAADENLKQTEKMADQMQQQRLEQQSGNAQARGSDSPSGTGEESGQGQQEYGEYTTGGYARNRDPRLREARKERRLQGGAVGRPVQLPATRPAPRAGRAGVR